MAAPSAEALADRLEPLTRDREHAAILCDIDGTLAPIVARAEEASVPARTSALLATLGERYGLVACVSGRRSLEARRLVGVREIAYAGAHGAELLEPGASEPLPIPGLAEWEGRIREFARGRDGRELRELELRIEDKGAIAAFHWRGTPDETAAQAHARDIARRAEDDGLVTHWGRKVLEVRPPIALDKGLAVRNLLGESGIRAALFGGDDATDLDAFGALEGLVAEGKLDHIVRVGVESEEGPAAIVERSELVVDGVDGFALVLELLAEA